jgi:hypothetical protein
MPDTISTSDLDPATLAEIADILATEIVPGPTVGNQLVLAATENVPHTVYEITIDYDYSSGLIQLPVGAMSTSLSCVVVQNSAQVSQKKITWIARRIGYKPVIPHPISNDTNLVLLAANISMPDIGFGADLTIPAYTVKGTYIYAMLQSFIPGTGTLTGAVSPLYVSTPSLTLLPSTVGVDDIQFSHGITDMPSNLVGSQQFVPGVVGSVQNNGQSDS